MGLVCTVALMGDTMATSDVKDDYTEASLLALERMQQVLASKGRYNTSKVPLFPTYVAEEEDLKKIDVKGVELVS